METQFPIKHKKFFKPEGFRFILAKTRFPVEKHEDESGAWQQRVKLPITIAMRAKSPRFQNHANEIKNLSKAQGGGDLVVQVDVYVAKCCKTLNRQW